MIPDPRFLSCAQDYMRARAMLTELHQQILNTRDRLTLEGLLAKYLALATSGRLHPPSATITRAAVTQDQIDQTTQAFQMMSQISKSMHEMAKAIIQNVRA